MPPIVAAAIITGVAGAGTAAIGAHAQGNSTRRTLAAQDAAAKRAEAATLEEERINREDQARRDAEDKRRWDVEQANLAKTQAQVDARQTYEDQIRYGKMVNLARLTGQPIPPPPPANGGAGAPMPSAMARPVASAPLLSRPSTANAAIAPPGSVFDPMAPAVPQRMPISALSGRRM